MKSLFYIALFLCVLGGAFTMARAQEPVPPPAPAYEPLSDQQLDQLLGPIALYPDPLMAQLLPAATLPEQIVLADRYLSGGGDPNAVDGQPWDASVQAMAHYPSVLQWMDQNLDWTTELGQAFLNQQQDVMSSIQRLRQSAYNLGNLQSTPDEQVINDDGYIQIVPVDPNMIYVPEYQPDQVFYDAAGGVPFITYGTGFAIGPWLDCDFDWMNHNLIVWGRDHPRPANWWHESLRDRGAARATVWHAGFSRSGAVASRGDRGWGEPQHVVAPATRRVAVPAIRNAAPPNRTIVHPIEDVRPSEAARSIEAARPAPAPVEHFQPASRPEPSGAFIGIQSSRDTRTFSARGQQSMQAAGGGGHGGRR
jgi:hypothetical protein